MKKKSIGKYKYNDQKPFIVMLLPFFTLFFIFLIVPIFFSVTLSFTSFDMISFLNLSDFKIIKSYF